MHWEAAECAGTRNDECSTKASGGKNTQTPLDALPHVNCGLWTGCFAVFLPGIRALVAQGLHAFFSPTLLLSLSQSLFP